MGTGPPASASPLAPNAASSPIWNYATAAGPGAKTGSAAQKTLACATSPHGFDQNQLCCELVALACDLLAWTQMLALTGPARRWEPNGCGRDLHLCRAYVPRRPPQAASASPPAGHGLRRCPTPSPAPKPSNPADQPETTPAARK